MNTLIMKTYQLTFTIFLLAILASCKQSNQMLTIVNADGSIDRTLFSTADSAFMSGDTAQAHNPLPIHPDKNWQVSWRYKTSEWNKQSPFQEWLGDTSKVKEPVNVSATRHFSGVEEMNRLFRLKSQHQWSNLKVTYQLKKQFRWFYTDYTYIETYPQITTFTRIPLSNYLTENEAQLWFNGNEKDVNGLNGIELHEKLDNINNQCNKWIAHNIMDEAYDYLTDNYSFVKTPVITREKLIDSKKAFIESSLQKFELFMSDNDFATCMDDYFKTKAFSKLSHQKGNPITQFEKSFENRPFIGYFNKNISFDYQLLMPGRIVNANTSLMHGDTLCWKVDAYRMAFRPLTLEAHSRKANIWAFAIAIAIILAAIASFFYRRK
jgi:hypothetical protein